MRLSAVTICLAAAYLPTAEPVVFTEEAEAALPAAFAHITFSVKAADWRRMYVDTADKLLESYMALVGPDGNSCFVGVCNWRDETSKTWTEEAKSVRETRNKVEEAVAAMVEMVFGSAETRPKRQLAVVAGIAAFVSSIFSLGASLKNAASIHEFRGRLATVEDRQEALVHLSENLSRAEARDARAILALMDKIKTLERNLAREEKRSWGRHIQQALKDLYQDAREMAQAVELLHNGIVSPYIVDFRELKRAFNEVRSMAARRGLKTAYDRYELLLTAHAAYWTAGDALEFAIPVPVVDRDAETLMMLRVEDTPTSVSHGLQVVFQPEHRYIAVAKDRSNYYALTEEDWRRCTPVGGVHYCTDVRTRYNSFDLTCIGALYQSVQKIVSSSICPVLVRKAPPTEVKEAAPGLLSVDGEEKIQWRMSCRGKPDTAFKTSGPANITVEEGCAAHSKAVTYTNLPRTVENKRRLQFVAQELLGHEDLPDFNITAQLLDHLDADGFKSAADLDNAARKVLLKKLEEAHARLGDSHSVLWYVGLAVTVTAGTALAGLLAAAAFTLYKQRKHRGELRDYVRAMNSACKSEAGGDGRSRRQRAADRQALECEVAVAAEDRLV